MRFSPREGSAEFHLELLHNLRVREPDQEGEPAYGVIRRRSQVAAAVLRLAIRPRGRHQFGELRAQQTCIGSREEQRDAQTLASDLIPMAVWNELDALHGYRINWRRVL